MAEALGYLEEEIAEVEIEQYLTFKIDNEEYGVKISYVNEIIGLQKITEVPDVQKYIKGIINLRGMIVPVMDLRLKFKKEEIEYNDRTCVIIVSSHDIYLGLIVDSVSEVINLKKEDVVPPPSLSVGDNNKYIMGIGKVGKDIKLLLDTEKLLTDDDADELSNLK